MTATATATPVEGTSDYEAFLRLKFDFHADYGFDVDPADLSPCLLPHQRDIVRWALKGGRRALFESFGLGKSVQQLEILRLIHQRERGRCLIVCPLGVRQEFTRDARDLLGIELRFIRRTDELGGDGLYITNYESIRDGRLDPDLFDAVSLDEASVLRSYGSKTYQSFLGLFQGTKYRFVATATPSPNRYKELIHYAGFLGVMDTGQALTRFFQRDSTQANNLTLYPHKEAEFFVWLHSWAIFLQRPSDLGYSDEGYDLPELEVVWHEIPNLAGDGGADRDGQGRIFRDAALGVSAAAREKRDTLPARVAAAKAIVEASPDDHFILWHDLESERHALKAALPETVEVFGNLDLDTREERIIGFSDGDFRLLATKPTLSGSGCNFQRHCHRQVFVGVGFKFNDFIQAMHRTYRYLQRHPVRIDVIYAESEREVVKTLRRKWAQHKELTAQMSDLIRAHGLDQVSISKALERSLGVARVEISGEGWSLANNDCVDEYQSHIAIGEALDGQEGLGVLPSTFMLLAPASPHPDVWHDVNRMRTLNGEQVRRGLAMHVCPLQFDIVDRLIERYSNEGDLVYDPFAGLGTVPMRALRLGRRGRGVELNPEYFTDAVRYLQAEEMRAGTPSLFDMLALEGAADTPAEASS